jgi:hypothetical protein
MSSRESRGRGGSSPLPGQQTERARLRSARGRMVSARDSRVPELPAAVLQWMGLSDACAEWLASLDFVPGVGKGPYGPVCCHSTF